MSTLSARFAEGRKCFIPYITAGDPGIEETEAIVLALARAGADIVEIGIPFSDPVADGPVIQRAAQRALRHNLGWADYLELVRRIRTKSDVGLLFMTYCNPVLRHGMARLDEEGFAAGLDGILVSDLVPEENDRLTERFTRLEQVFLAAPTSTDERLRRIAAASRGFVYLVARTGVTGARSDLEASLPALAARLRRITDLPLAAGFGIATADDVRSVWRVADGAIVGSAIVRCIEEQGPGPGLAEAVARFVRERLLPAVR